MYLVFALFTGGLLLATILSLSGAAVGNMAGFGAMLGAVALWRLKRHAWRDRSTAAICRCRATRRLVLPQDRTATVFERPHTEANYLNKEMGFVVARKHSRKLRMIASILFALIPALCALPVWFIVHLDADAVAAGRVAVGPGRHAGRTLAVFRRSQAPGDALLLTLQAVVRRI